MGKFVVNGLIFGDALGKHDQRDGFDNTKRDQLLSDRGEPTVQQLTNTDSPYRACHLITY